MKIVSVIFCSSGSFRVFNRNIAIGTHLKSLSAVNQRKTIAAAATGCPTVGAIGTGSKNVFTFSYPSQIPLSGGSSSAKAFSSNSVYQEKSALPLKLPTSRSFVEALDTSTNRTVSKEERSTILSTLYGLVDVMDVIGVSRTVCR
jgi:hypothetical protein